VKRLMLPAVLLAVLAGCTPAAEGPPAPEVTGDFAVCANIGTATPPPSRALPAVELPCFDGRSTVQLSQIKGPAVINLWASWCPPCQEELPALARLAAKPSAPTVIGVATLSRRPAAAALAADLGVTFPTVFDEDNRFGTQLGITSLPATIFVNARGEVTEVYRGVALTDATLAELVESRL
jgi:cytochrome c biogenesis protein CcmG/thiol:disulfide interchange protein DsbE